MGPVAVTSMPSSVRMVGLAHGRFFFGASATASADLPSAGGGGGGGMYMFFGQHSYFLLDVLPSPYYKLSTLSSSMFFKIKGNHTTRRPRRRIFLVAPIQAGIHVLDYGFRGNDDPVISSGCNSLSQRVGGRGEGWRNLEVRFNLSIGSRHRRLNELRGRWGRSLSLSKGRGRRAACENGSLLRVRFDLFVFTFDMVRPFDLSDPSTLRQAQGTASSGTAGPLTEIRAP